MCVVIKMTKYFWKIKKIMIQMCVVILMTKYFLMVKKKMIQKCVVMKMTKYFWMIKNNNDTNVCCHEDDGVKL